MSIFEFVGFCSGLSYAPCASGMFAEDPGSSKGPVGVGYEPEFDDR